VGETQSNDGGQAALWNGPAGRAWVDAQALTDRVYEPFEHLLVDAVAAVSRGAVLDVGCGTGQTTAAIARRLGVDSRCTGVDISEPMIAAARARVERDGTPARFIRADAQDYAFEPASVDTIMSRFGVMFFDDPVRAFVNLRRAGTDDAALRVIVWRSAAENPFMTTAERAAAPLLPNLPPRRPDGPGQFAFADDRRVRGILAESGWTDVGLRPIDVECTFPETDLVPYLTRLGPVGLSLQEADEPTRTRVVAAIRPAFDPYVHGADVRFIAACWMVEARGASR
jgi:SAM-dependent methyltransferase